MRGVNLEGRGNASPANFGGGTRMMIVLHFLYSILSSSPDGFLWRFICTKYWCCHQTVLVICHNPLEK